MSTLHKLMCTQSQSYLEIDPKKKAYVSGWSIALKN